MVDVHLYPAAKQIWYMDGGTEFDPKFFSSRGIERHRNCRSIRNIRIDMSVVFVMSSVALAAMVASYEKQRGRREAKDFIVVPPPGASWNSRKQ